MFLNARRMTHSNDLVPVLFSLERSICQHAERLETAGNTKPIHNTEQELRVSSGIPSEAGINFQC